MSIQFSCDKDGIVNFNVDTTTKYNRAAGTNVSGWSKIDGGPGNQFKSITESTGKVTHQSSSIQDTGNK
jgi:hypothetical protein